MTAVIFASERLKSKLGDCKQFVSKIFKSENELYKSALLVHYFRECIIENISERLKCSREIVAITSKYQNPKKIQFLDFKMCEIHLV